jgi:hypothetical protein
MAGDDGTTEPLLGSHGSGGTLREAYTSSSTILLVVIIALFAILVEYPDAVATDAQIAQYYWW